MIRNISVLLLFNQVLTTNVSQTDVIRYRRKECLGRGMDKTRVEKLKVVDWSWVGGEGGFSSGSMWNGVGQALSHAHTPRTHAYIQHIKLSYSLFLY